MEDLTVRRCNDCSKNTHPCSKCLPRPSCAARMSWNPTRCRHGISSPVTMNRARKNPACKAFLEKKIFYISRISNANQGLGTDLDAITIKWLIDEDGATLSQYKPTADQCWEFLLLAHYSGGSGIIQNRNQLSESASCDLGTTLPQCSSGFLYCLQTLLKNLSRWSFSESRGA